MKNTILSKNDLKDLINNNREETILLLSENGYIPKPTQNYIAVSVNGLKVEYQNSGCFRAGYGSGEENLEKIGMLLSDEYGNNFRVDVKKSMVDVHGMYTPEDFLNFCNFISEIDLNLKNKYNEKIKEEVGVSFSGTIFENLKERGATMSPMFCKLVCDVSKMELVNIQAEFHTKENGEIDGVEFCSESKKPITIFECQSGIHNGNFLDENHLNKTLNKYLYSSEILPTLKKIVLLAGGYYENHLKIIRERSKELLNREMPIEIILLKTSRVDDNISIKIVEYK
jgi:hypothetical protein